MLNNLMSINHSLLWRSTIMQLELCVICQQTPHRLGQQKKVPTILQPSMIYTVASLILSFTIIKSQKLQYK